MISPILSPGGKGAYARRLVQLYPHHRVYCEPFAGGAACYFNKPIWAPKERLNDMDQDIVRTYRWLRDATNRDLAWMTGRDWVVSQEGFDRALDVDGQSDGELVYRFIYRRRASFMLREDRLMTAKLGQRMPINLERLMQWRLRLSKTDVTHGDALDLIPQLDQDDVLLFLDPPWVDFWDKWDWPRAHMERMVDLLRGLENATFIWAETPDVIDEFDVPAEWSRTKLYRRSRSFTDKRTRLRHEAVFSNRPLKVD